MKASDANKKALHLPRCIGVVMKYKIRKDGRIEALKDFGSITKGTIGGFISEEENLSHEGNCWVYGNARVSGKARVFGDARVFENAKVDGNAKVYGKASVSGSSIVNGVRPYYCIQAPQHTITATLETITIGCETHTPKHWLENYKQIGKANGYTKEQIAEYGAILFLFKEWK